MCDYSSPEAETICLAAQAGLVGCSIEDYTGDRERGICDSELAVERVQAACEAAAQLPFPFMLRDKEDALILGCFAR